MNIVYLFCEDNSVKIPFLNYNKKIYYQFMQFGGVWDGDFYGFIFKQKINLNQLKSFFNIICLITNNTKDSCIPKIHYYGFLDEPCKKNENSASLHNQSSISYDISYDISYENNNHLEKLPEHLLNKLNVELRSRKYSLKTQKAYVYYVRLLCRTLQKSPEEINHDDVTEFLAIIEKDRKYSTSSINLAISAVKFFFRYIMKDNSIKEQKRPSQNKNLPMVLSTNEIIKVLSMIKNLKHRLLLTLVYSSGLRVSEVVALKKEHIDLSRRVIYIKLGKGRKDRYTMLSEKAALLIQEYYVLYNIDKWVFQGQSGVGHLTIRSAQRIFDKAVCVAGITKKISIHGLRHTFATHLLENGTDIRYIQELLGHTNVRTTERYTYVAKRNILKIKSPLDSI